MLQDCGESIRYKKKPHALFPSLHLSLIQPIMCMLYVIQVP
jgi:hypothetical protein